MNLLLRILVATLIFYSTSFVWAVEYSNGPVVFEIVQSDMVFDNSSVESAILRTPKNTKNNYGYGVTLKLRNNAAHELNSVTAANIGRKANIMINGIIISSATIQSGMGSNFSIAGLTKEQAEKFINNLALKK